MEKVIINTRRNGYEPEQCKQTITVGELIEMLSEYEADAPIYTAHDNGYTYGSIYADDVSYYECD